MAGRWCAGGRQPVRVVHGDGQVLTMMPPVTVADVLDGHPHHYICHMSPDLPSNKSPMLPVGYELEPGYVYFLLPLPRLFPTSSSGPPSCCCRASNHDRSLEEGHTTPGRRAQLQQAQKRQQQQQQQQQQHGFSMTIGRKSVLQVMDRLGSPMRMGKKVSPDVGRSPLLSPTYGALKHSKRGGGGIWGSASPRKRCVSPNSSPNRLRENARSKSGGRPCFVEDLCTRWKPNLGCISETDALVTACEELRLCLDRRRLTFDAKVRPGSPVRLAEVCRIAPREKHMNSQMLDSFSRPIKHMPLAGYAMM